MKLKADVFACTVLTAVKLLGWKNKAKRKLAARADGAADAAPVDDNRLAVEQAEAMLTGADRLAVESLFANPTSPKAEGRTSPSAAGAVAALMGGGGAKKATTGANAAMVEKARKRLEKAQKNDKAFLGIVAKFWAAMTDNGNLESVTFSLYQKVHLRITKTLAPDFTEQEAREVAKEDFASDTGGGKIMTNPQLLESLYELACLWAKAQLEQLGHKCETEHLVYFLAEILKNIADELTAEARRLVSLKDLNDIEAQKDVISSNFKQEFQGGIKPKKASVQQVAAANKARRKLEEEAKEAETRREKEEEEARMSLERHDAAAAAAAKREAEMTVEQSERRALHDAAASLLNAAYDRLSAAKDLRKLQLRELDDLIRKMARLDAVRVRKKLVREDAAEVVAELQLTRERWEKLSDALTATEKRIVMLERAVEVDKLGIAELSPEANALAQQRSPQQQHGSLIPSSSVMSGQRLVNGWVDSPSAAATPSPPVSPTYSPQLPRHRQSPRLGSPGSSDSALSSRRYGGSSSSNRERQLQPGPSAICLHVPSAPSKKAAAGLRQQRYITGEEVVGGGRMDMRTIRRPQQTMADTVAPAAAAGARGGLRSQSAYGHDTCRAVRQGKRDQHALRETRQFVDRELRRLKVERSVALAPARLQPELQQHPARPHSAFAVQPPPARGPPPRPTKRIHVPAAERDSGRVSSAFYFNGRSPPADGGTVRGAVALDSAIGAVARPRSQREGYLVESSWDLAAWA